MRQTTNYQLPSWDSDDRILRTDFNDLTEKVDTALKNATDSVTSLSSQLGRKGNCKIYTTSYTGTGDYGDSSPTTISFSGTPQLVVVVNNNTGTTMTAVRGSSKAQALTSTAYQVKLTWSGSTLKMVASSVTAQMNESGNNYLVVALISL